MSLSHLSLPFWNSFVQQAFFVKIFSLYYLLSHIQLWNENQKKCVSLVWFFYKSCERKTIPLILSPESQLTLTILSTLRPLYHNPHSHSLQFTKIYYISYKFIYSLQFSYTYIYIFFVLCITIQTSTSQFSQLQNWLDRERKMLDVYGIKNFSYF